MEDENKKDEDAAGPSAGKKEKNDDEDNNDHDRKSDARSYSVSSESFHSRRSGRTRGKSTKDTELRISSDKVDEPDRKRRVRRGRVRKQRRSTARRRYRPAARRSARSATKRCRILKEDEEDDMSKYSVARSGRSSRSMVRTMSHICGYCGHRCCGRRCERDSELNPCRRQQDAKKITMQIRRAGETRSKKNKRKLMICDKDSKKIAAKRRDIIRCKWDSELNPCQRQQDAKKITMQMRRARETKTKKNKRKLKTSAKARKKTAAKRRNTILKTEGIQAGSRSKILSPLFVSTNAELTDNASCEESQYLEIFPEMIYDTIEYLNKWKQDVPFGPILNYIMVTYPVHPDKEFLTEDLSSKLAVATMSGIIEEVLKGDVRHWRIPFDLLKRGLTRSHVTLFWKIYCDTMQPIRRRICGHNVCSSNISSIYSVCQSYSRLPVSRCISRYLWSTPTIYETGSRSTCTRCVSREQDTKISVDKNRTRKPSQRTRKSSNRRKHGSRTFKLRKVDQNPERRHKLQDITKSKLRIRSFRKVKHTESQDKIRQIVYNFKHQNSIQVLRKRWQQSRSDDSAHSEYIGDIQRKEIYKGITINNSNASIHTHSKETSNMKTKDNNLHEIVTIQDVKECRKSNSNHSVFGRNHVSLAPTSTLDIDGNLLNKHLSEETRHIKGTSSKVSNHQIQNSFQTFSNNLASFRSAQGISFVAKHVCTNNSINHLPGHCQRNSASSEILEKDKHMKMSKEFASISYNTQHKDISESNSESIAKSLKWMNTSQF